MRVRIALGLAFVAIATGLADRHVGLGAAAGGRQSRPLAARPARDAVPGGGVAVRRSARCCPLTRRAW